MSTIVVFEDSGYRKLLPLVYSRPVYELKCGMSTLREKISRRYPSLKTVLFCRSYLSDITANETGLSVNKTVKDDCLFINGRILMKETIPLKGGEEIGVMDGTVVYARLAASNCRGINSGTVLSGKAWEKLGKDVKTKKVKHEFINNSWDITGFNTAEITRDFDETVKKPAIKGKVYPGVHLLNKSRIHIGEGSTVKPGVVLDAEEGPIYIGKNVKVLPTAVIEGPASIDDSSIIRIGAQIREGSSIGKVCRVGGEVEESIIHGYSNKQHLGFLGHAYVGKWCNMGADTNNSDLKNNYSTVKVYSDGEFTDSGIRFVGLTMADHTKTGIGTMFDTGTVVGFSVNVYGAGLQPKFIASYSWGGLKGVVPYDAGKAIKTAKIVMSRRKVEMTDAEEKLFHKIHKLTEQERKNFIQQLRF